MKTCMFYTYVFSPFSAYFSPHYIVVEKGLLIWRDCILHVFVLMVMATPPPSSPGCGG